MMLTVRNLIKFLQGIPEERMDCGIFVCDADKNTMDIMLDVVHIEDTAGDDEKYACAIQVEGLEDLIPLKNEDDEKV